MNADIRIQQATKRDIQTLITLQKNDGFPHQYYLTPERITRLLNRGELFFIAIAEGAPVGFASVDCEIRAQAHFLCVDKRYTRRGIGRLLMQTLMNEAIKRRYTRLCSYVEANSTKEVFLQKHGFVRVGYYKNKYGNGQDATIWEVDLAHQRDE